MGCPSTSFGPRPNPNRHLVPHRRRQIHARRDSSSPPSTRVGVTGSLTPVHARACAGARRPLTPHGSAHTKRPGPRRNGRTDGSRHLPPPRADPIDGVLLCRRGAPRPPAPFSNQPTA
ncbi:hypothetical protein ZWY2020_012759 [Hordeum vulgare]|nr:hypothetical protein ZWY2020_012759 [Hordeum vulgare]